MSDGDDSGAADQAQQSVTLPAESLGGQTPQKGDELTFCVTGSDETGVTGYWKADDDGDEGAAWENDFRKSMSAQNNSTEPA